MKKRYLVFIALLFLMVPVLPVSGATPKFLGGPGKVEGTYKEKKWKIYSYNDAGDLLRPMKYSFEYEGGGEVAIKNGHTWYDTEELLFSEMVQVYDTEEVEVLWEFPDRFYGVQDICSCYVENGVRKVLLMRSISMDHDYLPEGVPN